MKCPFHISFGDKNDNAESPLPPCQNVKERFTRNPGWGEKKEKDLFLLLCFWKLKSSNFFSGFRWGLYFRGVIYS